MSKPTITKDQIVKSSEASKKFGGLRKKAKLNPIFITDNGNIDSVLICYSQYEEMYKRLIELELLEEEHIISKRIERLEKNPELTVSWKDIRRSSNNGWKKIWH